MVSPRGYEAAPRDSVTRRLAHKPLGWRPTTSLITIRRYRCTGCGHVSRQDTSRARTAAPSPHTGCRKRPLILPDHDRVPAPAGAGQLGGFRAAAPRHRPALPGVEELRHDLPVPADQRTGLLPLPHPRRHRILPVLRRHPPVKREPQATGCLPVAGIARRGPERAAPGLRTKPGLRTELGAWIDMTSSPWSGTAPTEGRGDSGTPASRPPQP